MTVADSTLLDYESNTSHTIVIRATSADGSTTYAELHHCVDGYQRECNHGDQRHQCRADFVLENSAVGTTVGIAAFADDADGTDVVTYSLDDNAGGRFAIDANTGIITVAGSLDRETADQYDVIVRATSTDATTTTRLSRSSWAMSTKRTRHLSSMRTLQPIRSSKTQRSVPRSRHYRFGQRRGRNNEHHHLFADRQ